MSKVAKWIFPAAGGKDGIIGTAKSVVGFLTGNAGMVMDGVRQVAGAGRKGDAQARQASVLNLQLGEVPRQAVIGIACTAGSLVDVFSFGGQYGTDKVTRCVALADHAIDGIEGFYINEVYYPWVGEGLQAAFGNKLSFHFRQATVDGHEPPAHVMANGGWPATDRLVGLTVMWIDWYVDDKIWPQGHPAIRFVLRGLRVYDPRFDPQYGYTGPNPQTWADRSSHRFSRNAKVLRYAYTRGIFVEGRQGQPEHLLIGRGLSEEESPGDLVIPDANLCDEIVDGVARYTANGVISASQPFIEVDGMFAAAMAGVIVQREGTVDVEAGQAKAVVATFTDADLIPGEKVGFSRFLGDNDGGRLNTFIGRYIEPLLGWKDHSAPVRRSQADIQADGGPRESTMSLSLVTEVKQADRIVEINRLLSRLERRGNVVLPPRFAGLEEGDWVAWQSARRHKGATVRYRIEAYREPETWRKYLTLREIASSVFGVPDPVEETTTPPPAPQVIDALALTGVTAEAITLAGETSVIPAIRFTWTAPVDAAVRAIMAEVRQAGSTDASPTRAEIVNSGVLVVTNGVCPDRDLECRLTPIGDPSRPVVPSAWLPVSTSTLVAGDLSPNAPNLVQIFGNLDDLTALTSAIDTDLDAARANIARHNDEIIAAQGRLDAQAADILALDTGLDGVQLIVQDHTTQIAGKASRTVVDAQILRIDDAVAVNASQADALVELESGKVSLSEYDLLKAEVEAARAGAPSLLAQIAFLQEVDLDLLNNKASTAALTIQTSRIDDAVATNAAQADTLVDLQNGKVAVSTFESLLAEVEAGRDGRGSLLARIQALNEVDLDLAANKASLASVTELGVRAGNTEADVIDISTALAAEALARAQDISQVTARANHVANLIDNPSGASDFRSWIKEGGPNTSVIDDAEEGRIFVVGDYMVTRVYSAGPNQRHSLSYSASPVGGGHVRLQYVTPSGLVEGVFVANTLADKNERRRSSASSLSPAGTTGFRLVVAPPSGGVLPVWAIKVNNGNVASDFSDDYSAKVAEASITSANEALVDLQDNKAEASALVATQAQLDDLDAETFILQQSLSDAQTKLAIGRIVLNAAATGGRPARLGLYSDSNGGSAVALDAAEIWFGANTVFDDASDTVQTVWESTRKVMAWGAPFGPDNLVEWTGPSSIALSAMTKANAGFWVDQFGAYGPTPLPSFWARVTPTQITRSRTGAGSISTALNDVIVTCYTGTSGATCNWSLVSGDASISYPASGFTPVFNTTLAAGQTKTALFVGLVAKGGDVDLVYVNVEFSDNV